MFVANQVPFADFVLFDNIVDALITIFHCITLEDWSNVMYMVQDAFHPIGGAVFFVVLIFYTSFFLLNLLLAVMWNTFKNNEEERIAHEARMRFHLVLDPAHNGYVCLEKMLEAGEFKGISPTYIDKLVGELKLEPNFDGRIYIDDKDYVTMSTKIPSGAGKGHGDGGDPLNDPTVMHFPPLRRVVTHPAFERFILIAIVVNTVLLGLDRHPLSAADAKAYEQIGFVCTVVFTLEMVVAVLGMGPRLYFGDSFSRFDFVIVQVSLVELVLLPPYWLVGDAPPLPGASAGGSGGAISALRTFRLARVLRLLTKYVLAPLLARY